MTGMNRWARAGATKRRVAQLWLLTRVVCAISLVQACGGLLGPSVGSESHFLRVCGNSADCGGSLSCVSGLCTQSCLLEEVESCDHLSTNAACINESVEPGNVAVCDVVCSSSTDCRKISSEHTCVEGFCRAGLDSPASVEPMSTAECPAIESLSQIAKNEGPFTLCEGDSDCADGHLCHGNEGMTGFCQTSDADIFCDGEGDVNLQAVPLLPDWGPGMCVYSDWRDYLCCEFPDQWDCP